MSAKSLKEENLYQKAVSLWGFESQVQMMIEEMAELTTALCHIIRSRGSVEAVMEELADVEIMLGQMKIIFPSIETIKKEKLERLALLIEKEKSKENNWGGTLIGPSHEKAEVIGRVFKKALS